MSNERIDLTQFEGIKEWEVEKRPDGGYAIKTGRDNFSLEEAETLAKLPTLIAELKRCYEEIDYLNALTNNLPIEMLVEAENKLQASEWGYLDE